MMNARVLCVRARKPVTLEAGLTEHRHPPSQKHCGARRRRAPSYRHWCEPEGYVESSSMPIRRLLLRHGPTRTLDRSFDSPVSGFDAGRVFRIAHRVSSRKRRRVESGRRGVGSEAVSIASALPHALPPRRDKKKTISDLSLGETTR